METSTVPRPPRICVLTFGCQMNVFDGELVLSRMRRKGWEITGDPAEADLLVINTCSVREHAEERVMSRLGQLKARKRRDPGFRIAVMGCMAQRMGEDLLRRAPHVDVVCGSQQFPRLLELLEAAEHTGRPSIALSQDGVSGVKRDIEVRARRHQAFVAAMRGCHHRCSYCVVPRTRGGREESRPVAEIVEEVRALADDGVREVTLLGQNINSYGRSLGKGFTLAVLLRAVHEVAGIDRIRFITSNPMDLGRELLLTMGELPRVMEYLHLPVQSGSNRVLSRMARGYTREHYLELTSLARELVPGIELATDLIVGFPGETEEDFRETVDLMERVRFQNAYVFKYSPRPGTKAANWENDVSDKRKKERNRHLLRLQARHSLAKNQVRIGRRYEVLAEGPSPRRAARLTGRTRSNQNVVFFGGSEFLGRLVTVEVHRVTALTLIGEVVDS